MPQPPKPPQPLNLELHRSLAARGKLLAPGLVVRYLDELAQHRAQAVALGDKAAALRRAVESPSK